MINELEVELRTRVPSVHTIFIEPDVFVPGRDAAPESER